MCYLGAILGHLGAMLGQIWRHLGLAWCYLGATLCLPGPTVPLPSFLPIAIKFCLKTCVSCKRNACFWNPPTWAVSRTTFEASLGRSWALLDYREATLEPSWAILGPSWAILGLPGASLAELTKNLPWQILCNAKFARANFA